MFATSTLMISNVKKSALGNIPAIKAELERFGAVNQIVPLTAFHRIQVTFEETQSALKARNILLESPPECLGADIKPFFVDVSSLGLPGQILTTTAAFGRLKSRRFSLACPTSWTEFPHFSTWQPLPWLGADQRRRPMRGRHSWILSFWIHSSQFEYFSDCVSWADG